MPRSRLDRRLPRMPRFDHGRQPIESRNAPAAYSPRALENDAPEFSGGTIRCIRHVVQSDDNAVLGIVRARREHCRNGGRFVRFRHARPGDGAFPGLLLILLPEEGAISIPDSSIFARRNGRICRELRAVDDAGDLITGADVLAAVGTTPDDSRGGRKYGYALV